MQGIEQTGADPMDSQKSDTPHTRLACSQKPLPAGTLDVGTFTDLMSHLAAAVCVATAGADGERFGRTITTAVSLSTEPPSLLISITRGTDLARLIVEAKGFSLSLLAEDQRAIGDAFAGRGDLADRFTVGDWDRWPSGHPRLRGATAVIDCSLAGIIEMDTHYLFAGIPVASQTSERPPLIWHKRSYQRLG